MKRVSVARLNQATSEVLQEVSAGASFVITNHGKPVATLSPHRAKAAHFVTFDQIRSGPYHEPDDQLLDDMRRIRADSAEPLPDAETA